MPATLLYVPSSFAIVMMGKRELVALLSMPSWCLVIVVWLFLGAMGLFAVCNCGISGSYSLAIFVSLSLHREHLIIVCYQINELD